VIVVSPYEVPAPPYTRILSSAKSKPSLLRRLLFRLRRAISFTCTIDRTNLLLVTWILDVIPRQVEEQRLHGYRLQFGRVVDEIREVDVVAVLVLVEGLDVGTFEDFGVRSGLACGVGGRGCESVEFGKGAVLGYEGGEVGFGVGDCVG
jgi:hypothetical protein